MKRSSQGLWLLSLVLMASSVAIAAPINNGESMIDGGRKSKMATIGANKAAIIHDDDIFNGCWAHDAESPKVCCTKDKLCWPSLSECAINCPCKVRCD